MNTKPNSDSKKRRILLVEDQMIIALNTRNTLEKYGYQVEIARTGEEAADLGNTTSALERAAAAPDKNNTALNAKKNSVDTKPFDLVLMDIDLGPGMDGTEAAKKILAKQTIPIVFLTSHSQKEMVERVKTITRYGYVLKQSGEFVLLSSIEMAFELFEAHVEQHKREQEAAFGKAYLEHFFQSIPEAIVLADTDERIQRVNRHFEQLFLYTQNEVEGCYINDLLVPERFHEEGHAFSRKILRGENVQHETIRRRKDGLEVDVSIIGTPFFYQDRQVGIVAIYQDITEIRQSEKRMQTIINTLPYPILAKDSGGRFVFVNKAFAQIFNMEPEELRGLQEGDLLISAERIAEYERIHQYVLQTNKPYFIPEEKIVHNDDTMQWVQTYKMPFNYYGLTEPVVLSVSSDITEIKEAEEKVIRLLREKELILKEVHHRIKNNMATIISLLSLQSATAANEFEAEVLQEAVRRIQTMLLIYDSLYKSSEYQTIDLKGYLIELVNKVKESYTVFGTGKTGIPAKSPVKEVIFTCNLDQVEIDANRAFSIGMIINELITNAFKYAYPDNSPGVVEVSLDLTTLESVSSHTGDYENYDKGVKNNRKLTPLSIMVADRGIGLPQDAWRGKQSGFGFSLVQSLAAQINGQVKVGPHLKDGTGTRFTIVFPMELEML